MARKSTPTERFSDAKKISLDLVKTVFFLSFFRFQKVFFFSKRFFLLQGKTKIKRKKMFKSKALLNPTVAETSEGVAGQSTMHFRVKRYI